MNRSFRMSWILVACWLCGNGLADDTADKAVPGIRIGAAAPDFQLKDQNGESRKLSEFVKSGESIALVFYRSADW